MNGIKIDNLDKKINALNDEKIDDKKKYNNLHSLYKEVTKELNKLDRRLRENDLELNNTKRDNEVNMNNLKDENRKYYEDNSKLYNELMRMKEENESLMNKNNSLANNNESMLTERKYNSEIITSYKDTIDKLNKEIAQLKKENTDLKNTLKSRKYNISKRNSHSSQYEDEIVIINKETTYSKGLSGESNDYNDKYGRIKNRYEIKRKGDITSNEILKYHEIIQDLSNMILIYEKFFFKDKIKPKNNRELFCYLLVQYINEKFKKIKANVFMNLLYKVYKDNDKFIEKDKYATFTERGNNRKRGYFSDNNKINNLYE